MSLKEVAAFLIFLCFAVNDCILLVLKLLKRKGTLQMFFPHVPFFFCSFSDEKHVRGTLVSSGRKVVLFHRCCYGSQVPLCQHTHRGQSVMLKKGTTFDHGSKSKTLSEQSCFLRFSFYQRRLLNSYKNTILENMTNH